MKALFEASQVPILNPLVNVLNEENFDLCSFKAEIKKMKQYYYHWTTNEVNYNVLTVQ